MKKTEKRIVLANAMSSIAKFSIREAANSRCAFVFHQPKQPCDRSEEHTSELQSPR